jgi:hypothetical protein
MVSVTGIALGQNADGRLELVATSADEEARDSVWHAYQTSPSGDWTGWHVFGRPGSAAPVTAPSLIQNAADGHLEVFVTSGDGTVWHRWQTTPNDDWSEWTSLGRPNGQLATSTPALALLPDSRVTAFVIADGIVWQASQRQPGTSSDWSAWSSLGQPGDGRAYSLSVELNADGRLEIFAVELSEQSFPRALWHRWQTTPGQNTWSDWSPLGTPIDQQEPGEQPVVGSSADGRLVLLTTDAEGAVWHRWQQTVSDSNSCAPWAALDRSANQFTEVTIGLDATGRLVLVAPSLDNGLWHTAQTAPGARTWASWSSLGSLAPVSVEDPTLANPTLRLNADGRMELFLRIWKTGDLYQLSATAPGHWWPHVGRLWPQP